MISILELKNLICSPIYSSGAMLVNQTSYEAIETTVGVAPLAGAWITMFYTSKSMDTGDVK